MDPRLLPPQEVPGWMGGALSSNAPKFLSGGYVDGQLQDNTAWANSDGTVTWVIGGQPQIMSRSAWDAEIQRQVANDRGLMGSLMEIGTQFVLPAVGAYYGLSGLDGLLNNAATTAALPASEVSALTPAAETAATEATGLSSLPSSVNTATDAFGSGVSDGLISSSVTNAATGSGTGAIDTGIAAGTGTATLPTSDGFTQGLTSDVAAGSGATTTGSGVTTGTGAGAGTGAGMLTGAASGTGFLADLAAQLGVSEAALLSLGSGALNTLGGLLASNTASDNASTVANAQLEAARIAADAARFRPVGVTTRFGTSNFTRDAQGNITGAGYTLSPDIAAQRERLIAASNGMLDQFTGSVSATAPMATAAQRAMELGNSYLAANPRDIESRYMADQQALLAPARERALSGMLAGEFNRGTYGLSTGSTSTGMTGANPRLEALYNAQRQQDLGLASQAMQGGMDYARFGAGMVGTGGELLNSMYGVQRNAYTPYQTAMGGAQALEGLGQNALDQGINLGRTTSNAQSGQLLANGMLSAAQTQAAANTNPWAQLLMGAGNTVGQMARPAAPTAPAFSYSFNPYTGERII